MIFTTTGINLKFKSDLIGIIPTLFSVHFILYYSQNYADILASPLLETVRDYERLETVRDYRRL